MAIEIIGMISTRPASEQDGPAVSIIGGHVDPDFVRRFTRAHEDSGFDKVLVGYGSSGPDGFSVAGYAASVTDRIGFLIAHRPGFVAPTLAARKFATLDQFTNGRVSMHVITGGSDAEQQRDGDWLDHDARYRRTDEYLDIVRSTWTSEKPFDYEGEFYHVQNAFSEVKPRQQPHVPVYFGGASGPAIPVGAKQSDIYMLWGEPLAWVKERITEVRDVAASLGREPRFSVSVRPILAATEEKAWDRAHAILGRIKEVRGAAAFPGKPGRPQAEGSKRLLEAAAAGELHDKRLWTPIAAAVGATGNTTALVGTPDQVAEALLDYYDAGATTILIRGFNPFDDAIDYGRELIPTLRAEAARRERQTAAV
ncbi:MAG: LLM class flavin-dependent oxidoreductase [Dehalococcoidia bacterium]